MREASCALAFEVGLRSELADIRSGEGGYPPLPIAPPQAGIEQLTERDS
jgi:hypothetical protein